MGRYTEQKQKWLGLFFCFFVLPLLLLIKSFPKVFTEEHFGGFIDDHGCVTLQEVVTFECAGNISALYVVPFPPPPLSLSPWSFVRCLAWKPFVFEVTEG
jgi:hypothetical protein